MKLRFVVGLLFVFFSLNTVAQSELESILSNLDSIILLRDEFDLKRENKIKALKEHLSKASADDRKRFDLQNKLIMEYRAYRFDSAFNYINSNHEIALQIEDTKLEIQSLLEKAKLLSTSGGYYDALGVLDKIDKIELNDTLFAAYYGAYRKLWEDLSYYTAINDNYFIFKGYQEKYTDSLILYISDTSDLFFDIQEKQYRDNRELDLCEQINTKRLSNFEIGTPEYSLIAFERSLIYELQGNQELRKKYLALSAISDIKAAIKDNASLTLLATILFNEGEVVRADRYIKFSFEDAEFFNSRLRFVEISNILPLITNAHEQLIKDQNIGLRNLIALISFLSIILFISLFAIFRQVVKLKRARNDLKDANSSLEKLNNDFKSANEKLESLNYTLYESDKLQNQKLVESYNEIKAREKKLKDTICENDSLKQALNKSAILAYTNVDGVITYVNEKFIEYSKYSKHELIGRDHSILNSGFHSKEFMKNLWDTILSGKIWQGEILNKAKDDTLYWLHSTIVPTVDANGKITQFISIRYNITDRKKYELSIKEQKNKLQLRNAHLEKIAWSFSHSVRAPVSTIMGLSNIFNYHDQHDKINKEVITKMKEPIGSLNQLISQIVKEINEVSKD